MASRGLADPDLKRNGPHSGPCDSAISVLPLCGGRRPAERASHKEGLTCYGGGFVGRLRGLVGGALRAATTRRCSDMWLAL